MHQKTAYIVIGQSGSGKGTQVQLLMKRLVEIQPLFKIFMVETGARFRTFMHGETYVYDRTKQYIEAGKLPPAFLGVYAWADMLTREYAGEDIIVFDGTPRIADEVPLLLGACDFLEMKVKVIKINVSDDWAREKAIGRGREDDRDAHELAGRLAWYHEQVAGAIELLKKNPNVEFIDINGEQTIPEVHEEICRALLLE